MYVAYRGNDRASYWWAMALLSPRQREILDLVAAGRTSKEIAGELGISESTVNWHISNAFGRLGASSRAEAVALAIRDDADRNNGNGTDNGNGADSGHGASQSESAPQPARRPAAPLGSTAAIVVVALTLLLSVLGGALVAGWHVTLTPPSPTAMPSAPAPTTAPTARPSGALVPPGATDAAPPARSTEATVDPQTAEVPAMPSPAPRLSAPALIAPVLPSAPLQAPTTQTALPSVQPIPTLPPLPTQLPVPPILPTPSVP